MSCPREGRKAKRHRAQKILQALREAYPEARTELRYENPFQLLVATVLSAQATDKSVNEATPALFARFPDAFALAQARPEEVEPYIKRIGLYKTKSRNLVALAKKLVAEYGGEVPKGKEALMALPGVGWKTATVVLGAAFGVPGIAVDTHVARVSRRLCLSPPSASNALLPEKIGAELEAFFPKEDWVYVHHALVLHGRYVCTARRPKCEACVLSPYCPSRRTS